MARFHIWPLAALIYGAFGISKAETAPLDAETLVRQIETQYQGNTSHGVAKMRVVTQDWTRELKLEAWGEGRDKFLVRILEPQKEAGIGTLKIGDDIWNYLPKIDRLLKVPSALMGEGWMGSHLTNDDLVKESKVDQLYSFSILFADDNTASIVAMPKPDAVVVWGKIVYTADHVNMVPHRVEYFDEDGVLMRTTTFADVRQVAGRKIPLTMRVVPTDAPGEYTEFRYESLTMDVKLSEDLFSLRSLRRR